MTALFLFLFGTVQPYLRSRHLNAWTPLGASPIPDRHVMEIIGMCFHLTPWLLSSKVKSRSPWQNWGPGQPHMEPFVDDGDQLLKENHVRKQRHQTWTLVALMPWIHSGMWPISKSAPGEWWSLATFNLNTNVKHIICWEHIHGFDRSLQSKSHIGIANIISLARVSKRLPGAATRSGHIQIYERTAWRSAFHQPPFFHPKCQQDCTEETLPQHQLRTEALGGRELRDGASCKSFSDSKTNLESQIIIFTNV